MNIGEMCDLHGSSGPVEGASDSKCDRFDGGHG